MVLGVHRGLQSCGEHSGLTSRGCTHKFHWKLGSSPDIHGMVESTTRPWCLACSGTLSSQASHVSLCRSAFPCLICSLCDMASRHMGDLTDTVTGALPPFLSGTWPCCCASQVNYLLPLSPCCHFPLLKHRSSTHFMLLKGWAVFQDWSPRVACSSCQWPFSLRPTLCLPTPHSGWLCFWTRPQGKFAFWRFCLFQSISRMWETGRAGLSCRGREGGSRRGTSKRSDDAKERTSQGLSSFPPWHNHLFEQKIEIIILRNTKALRIF